jgi:hypothetical protein
MKVETMREYISAKFLLAAPPPDVAVYPARFKITVLPEGRASGLNRKKGNAILGATSPRWSAMGKARR